VEGRITGSQPYGRYLQAETCAPSSGTSTDELSSQPALRTWRCPAGSAAKASAVQRQTDQDETGLCLFADGHTSPPLDFGNWTSRQTAFTPALRFAMASPFQR